MLAFLMCLTVTLIGTAVPEETVSIKNYEAAPVSLTNNQETPGIEQDKKKEKEKEKERKIILPEKIKIIKKIGKADNVIVIETCCDKKKGAAANKIGIHLKVSGYADLLWNKDSNIKISDDHSIIISSKDCDHKNTWTVKCKKKVEKECDYDVIEVYANGKDASYTINLKRDQKLENRMKMQIISKNKIGDSQLDRIKESVQRLKESLHKSYELTSSIDKSCQCVTIIWPLDLDKETHADMLKLIKKFQEELKEAIPSIKGKKAIRKKVTIGLKSK
jgi:hypothetical protein